MGGDVAYRLGTGQGWGWAGISGALAWSVMLWTSLSGGAAAFLQTHVRYAAYCHLSTSGAYDGLVCAQTDCTTHVSHV